MKTFFWKDKTGRGATGNPTSKGLLSSSDEENYDGDSLHEWIKDCDKGDEFENPTDKWICTSVKEDDPPKKIPAGTLDLEPTWESLLPVLLALHLEVSTTPDAAQDYEWRDKKELLMSQLYTMARGCDLFRQRQKEINSRIILVDDQPTTIGEYIKNNMDDLADDEYEMLLDLRPGEMITISSTVNTEGIIIVRPEN